MTMARNEASGLWGDYGYDDEWQLVGERRARPAVSLCRCEEVAAADIAA
jgi:hypothetical protein